MWPLLQELSALRVTLLQIFYQNNHKVENLDANINVDKTKAKDNDFTEAKSQYPTPNSSVFEAFFANSVGLSVKTTDTSESKKVDCSYENFFIATIAIKKHEYYSLKPAIIT